MYRERIAVQLVIVGLVLGFFGNALFYPYLTLLLESDLLPILGIGFPIFVTVVVVAGLLLARLHRIPLSLRRIWVVAPLLFFAVMVAVRADWVMMLVNILAVFALGGLLLHYLSHKRYLDQATALEYSLSLIATGFSSAIMPFIELTWVQRWMSSLSLRESKGLVQVGRGLLLATPVLIVFIILLGSADVIFAQRITDLLQNLIPSNGESLIIQVILIGIIAYVVIGMMAYGIVRAVEAQQNETTESESTSEAEPARKRGGSLGMIEAGIMLVSVNLLFLFFVIIQLQYLFGGDITDGFTYSAYARRGFFELVAVTVLVLVLGLWLDRATLRRSVMQSGLFRAMAIVMVTLTLVMLVSAWHRMSLYEMAYGFTRLRVYTHIFMLALGALLGAFLLELFRVKPAIFSFSLLLVMIAYVGILNVLNVEDYIAWRNIERDTSEVALDVCYLDTFSVDALPAMFHIYRTSEIELDRQQVLSWLLKQWNKLDRLSKMPITMMNFSQQSAYAQLDAMLPGLEDGGKSNPVYCIR